MGDNSLLLSETFGELDTDSAVLLVLHALHEGGLDLIESGQLSFQPGISGNLFS